MADKGKDPNDFNDLLEVGEDKGWVAVREQLLQGLQAPPVPLFGEVSPEGGTGEDNKPTRNGRKKEKPVDWNRYHELLDYFVLIYGTDTVYDLKNRMILKVKHLGLAYGSDYVRMWLGSEERKMILPEQLVFEPAGGREGDINMFDGFSCQPKAGDYEPILELLYHLCADSSDHINQAENAKEISKVVAWVLKWLALPLQRPGTKMRSALVFHGPQGAGKNLFFEDVMCLIYGRYGIVVGQDQLEDKFNDWASQKLLIIGDEVVARNELYHYKNKLKGLITGETIQINPKNLGLRTEANHANFVFLSNEHEPLPLEDGDRRYFMVYTPPKREDNLYARVADCLKTGGREAFYDFLMSFDLTGFSEFDHPPMTRAKADLIDLCLRPSERFLREWLAGYLPLPFQVCTVDQLYRAFRRWCNANGERFPPAQKQFSETITKSARLIGKKEPPLKLTGINLDIENGRKTHRVWLTRGSVVPEGRSKGSWATECVRDFERVLSSYNKETDGYG